MCQPSVGDWAGPARGPSSIFDLGAGKRRATRFVPHLDVFAPAAAGAIPDIVIAHA
jgi:hypothetical protein